MRINLCVSAILWLTFNIGIGFAGTGGHSVVKPVRRAQINPAQPPAEGAPKKADDPKLTWKSLVDYPTVSRFTHNGRVVILVGEFHPGNDPKDDDEKQKLARKVRDEILQKLKTEKFIYLSEEILRDEDEEKIFLEVKGLDPKKIAGKMYGLEEAKAKLVGMLMTIRQNSFNYVMAVNALDVADTAQRRNDLLKFLERLQKQQVEYFPAFVANLTGKARGEEYFNRFSAPYQEKGAKAAEPIAVVIRELGAVIKSGKHEDIEKFYRAWTKDGEKLGTLITALLETTKGCFAELAKDTTLDKNFLGRLPTNYFKDQYVETDQYTKYLYDWAKVRDEAMAKNAVDVLTQNPQDEVIIVVGDKHRESLEKLIRARLK